MECFTQGRREWNSEFFGDEIKQIETRAPFGDSRIFFRVSKAVKDVETRVQDKTSAVEARQNPIREDFGKTMRGALHQACWIFNGQIRRRIVCGGVLHRARKEERRFPLFDKNMLFAIDGREMALHISQCLAQTQHQQTACSKSEMQDRQHRLLGRGLEINEQIAATENIDAGEWRILQKIMLRKDHSFTNVADDLIVVAFFREVFLQ